MFASSLKPKSDASEKNLGLATIRTALHWRIDDVIWCVETRRFVLRLHASSHPFLDAFRLTHCGSGTQALPALPIAPMPTPGL